jgi:subtilisin family serine protease
MPKYIVTVKKDADLEEVAKGHGVKPRRVSKKLVRTFAADMTEAQAEGLRKNPNVVRVEDDEGPEAWALPWGLDRIDQRTFPLDDTYSFTSTGKGVPIYIVDTGIRYTHVEFGGRAVPGWDAYGGDGSDWQGHGTHVAGTAAGATYGVAKEAQIVSVRVLNNGGSGLWSDVIAGLEWIASQQRGVVNLSLGGPKTEAVNEACAALVALGFVVCVAAGNSDDDAALYSPASEPSVVTVGATYYDHAGDFRAAYSNWGPVDIFAPGSDIQSACFGSDTAVCGKSGTSMATPHVAGVVALALEEDPDASPEQVLGTIQETATQGAVPDSKSTTRDLLYARMDSVQTPDDPTPNVPPVADFDYAVSDPPLGYSFTDKSSDPDGVIINRVWAYGDGHVSTGGAAETAHLYAAPGVYLVTLDVTDDSRAIGHTQKSVTVGEPVPEPEPEPSVVSLSVSVTNQKGQKTARLSWSGARSEMVTIYRGGSLLAIAPNTGVYSDRFGKGKVPSYRVCETGLMPSACSSEVAA